MSETQPRRRLLIVDDQQEIHDTFERIFSPERPEDAALSDFEKRFLEADTEASSKVRDANPDYELEHANSGEMAAAMVRHAVDQGLEYAVAFVDMRMPQGLDGMETTELLWSIDPDLHIVICTAFSDHVWENVLNRLGLNDRLLLLKKPFESDEARQLALALSEKSRLAAIQKRKVQDLGREVERRRRAEESMRDMAHRDALTNLPNRPYLLEKLARLVTQSGKASSAHHAVLFLDLDNFKIINDSLGHDAGDELLNQVATRLMECVREHDMTSRVSEEGETVRLGGDEFVVLLEDLADPQDATRVAARIVKRISEPFRLCDRLVNIGTSVGIAYVNRHVRDAHEALRNADTAMYRAKNSGKGQVAVFDQTMHDDVVARLELENKLRDAIDHEKFTLNYQPIVDLQHGTIRGIEALIRWTPDDGNAVSPGQFIPMIEEIGMISRVGEWVLEKSMREHLKLIENTPEACEDDLYLGVNVSRRQLSDPFFFSRLNKIFERTGFERHRLKLEMNESSDTRGEEQALRTMIDLHDSGVGVQIDDFGKGQSSLTCFQAYPIEAVKIDRSFTASIATDHCHAVIAQAIVQLAHHLNARIVAEGVESTTQLAWLRKWGCDAAQGYLFSPPLSPRALRELIRDPLRSEGIRILRSSGRPVVSMDSPTSSGPINTLS
ncbi:MAG: EAL domain-containing protein [Rubripirellula sp.]